MALEPFLCLLVEGSNLVPSICLCVTDMDLIVTGCQWWNTGYGPDSRHRPGSQKVRKEMWEKGLAHS